jgi:hypothetical protein
MDKYNDAEDYNLEDPKAVDQGSSGNNSKWKEVNCPKEIEF